MPVKRRISKRRADLEDGAEQWLRGEPSGFFKFKRDEDLRALWAEHGDRIVAEWIANNPGTRPTQWWKYSAPEPRHDGESEAAYLERHGLLLPGERNRRDRERVVVENTTIQERVIWSQEEIPQSTSTTLVGM